MRLHLKLYGLIRDAAKIKETTIDTSEQVCLRKLLEILSEKYGRTFYYRVFEGSKNISTRLRVFVDGRLLQKEEYDNKISDGSTVSLVLAFAGGTNAMSDVTFA